MSDNTTDITDYGNCYSCVTIFCVTSLDFLGFCLRLRWVLCFSFSHALLLVVGTWNCVQVVFWSRSFQAIGVVELICE